MNHKPQEILVGTELEMYINGQLVSDLVSANVKITFKTEDIQCCKSYGTGNRIVSYAVEGDLTVKKTFDLALEFGEDMKKGKQPDIKLIGALTNISNNKTSRIALLDVIFTEIDWGGEVAKTLEEKVPFKAGDYQVLKQMTA